ncbi:MAG: endolytic transglycosylase MltG [Bdellovibrionales bacterium]
MSTEHQDTTGQESQGTPENGAEATPEPSPQPKRKKPLLPYVLIFIFLATLIPGPLFMIGLFAKGPLPEEAMIVIPYGTSIQKITELLETRGALVHPLLFRAAARLIAEDKLKAGEYKISPHLSAVDIATILRNGEGIMHQLTIPEGLTSYEVVGLLNQIEGLRGEIKKVPEEGSLLPETYSYNLNNTRKGLLHRMQKDRDDVLKALWDKRAPNLPLKTAEEAVILASIVEKETGYKAEERPRVAGVFINRLRIGIALQSDPTVIYAITKGETPLGRSLIFKDLELNSPYNTYVNAGLPPAPICNPGKAALEAVLNPEENDYLYFVADGSGGHAFASSLEEHNRNVAEWRKIKRLKQ